VSRLQYQREADMLGPIAEAVRLLVGAQSSSRIFFEVPTASGIPDIVVADLNESAITKRIERGLSPVVDLPGVSVLRAIQHRYRMTQTTSDIADIREFVGLSRRYLTTKVLPELVQGGHIDQVGKTDWAPTHAISSPAKKIYTIEVKVKDWRAGYNQALRHKISADRSWLVIDANRTTTVSAHHHWFKDAALGLATLDTVGGVCRLIAPQGHPSTGNVYRELLAERLFEMATNGVVSGPVRHVFGADLTTTRGPDPRLAGVAAH